MNKTQPMATKSVGFGTCRNKGFHITFENGWTVSVQFGGGNYCENYDGREIGDTTDHRSSNAEIAAWPNGGEMIDLGNGDSVKGYVTPNELLKFMNEIAAK